MKKKTIIQFTLLFSQIILFFISGFLYKSQQGEIFAANQNTPLTCSDIIGSWEWFNGGIVSIESDGTLSHKNEGGTWKRIHPEEPRFDLTWNSGWVNEMTLSEDGTKLDGYNQNKDRVSGQKIANSSMNVVGTYYWFNGERIIIGTDGRLFTVDNGTWKCIDPQIPKLRCRTRNEWATNSLDSLFVTR